MFKRILRSVFDFFTLPHGWPTTRRGMARVVLVNFILLSLFLACFFGAAFALAVLMS